MSALADRISSEMKTALLGGNRFRGELLRNIKAAILNEEVALGKRDTGLSDAEIEAVLARELKKRRESAELYRQNDRDDLADIEQQELEIIQEFLPEQLNDDEVRQIVEQTVAELGEIDAQNMGRVIGAVKSKLGQSVDGAKLAQIVKETLQK
ncbi:GatB/YqeY [Candidatus Saccharibacteria bacterium]|nr:GatB/YqeY [Candidatus Saccharibacteria bacterium]